LEVSHDTRYNVLEGKKYGAIYSSNSRRSFLIRARGLEYVNSPSGRNKVRAPQASSPGNPDAKTKRLILHSTVKLVGFIGPEKKNVKICMNPERNKIRDKSSKN
jgi:hypothetical protein